MLKNVKIDLHLNTVKKSLDPVDSEQLATKNLL